MTASVMLITSCYCGLSLTFPLHIISHNEAVFTQTSALWTLTPRCLSVSVAPVNTLCLNKPVTSANKAPLMSVLV